MRIASAWPATNLIVKFSYSAEIHLASCAGEFHTHSMVVTDRAWWRTTGKTIALPGVASAMIKSQVRLIGFSGDPQKTHPSFSNLFQFIFSASTTCCSRLFHRSTTLREKKCFITSLLLLTWYSFALCPRVPLHPLEVKDLDSKIKMRRKTENERNLVTCKVWYCRLGDNRATIDIYRSVA